MSNLLIFNWKLLIIVGIISIVFIFVIAFAFPPTYAGEEKEDCSKLWGEIQTTTCYQKQIIEKLDWNNCVQLAKKTYMYRPTAEGTDIWGYQTSSDLINKCGEIP